MPGKPGMRLKPDCIPCMLRMALRTARLSSKDEKVHIEVLENTLRLLLLAGWEKTPPEVAYSLQRMIRRTTGVMDPFAELKETSNQVAAELYPRMRELVKSGGDGLERAVRLAAAGNVMDFAAYDSPDLGSAIEDVMAKPFAINDYPVFRERVMKERRLLYFLDNAGEIYTDRLLIETMLEARGRPFEAITLVVKGGPIINDATLEDALQARLDELPHISFKTVSNGEEGTGPGPFDREIDRWIMGHDLVVAKGQGNYEVLEDRSGVFFILMVKCKPVAESLGVEVGDLVLKYSD